MPIPSLLPRCVAFGKAGQNPDSATRVMATASEVSCHGGEEAFVRAIIRDSLRLKKKVRLSCYVFYMLPGVLTKYLVFGVTTVRSFFMAENFELKLKMEM